MVTGDTVALTFMEHHNPVALVRGRLFNAVSDKVQTGAETFLLNKAFSSAFHVIFYGLNLNLKNQKTSSGSSGIK